jgi:chemotaxis protein MotB
MARRKEGGHGGGHGWFVTFADLMGLMMSFFVMLTAFSTQDQKKLQIVAGSMRDAFGVQTQARYSSIVEVDGLPTRPHLKHLAHIPPEQASQTPTPDDNGRDRDENDASVKLPDDKAFARAAASLRQALQSLPELNELAKQVMVEETPLGLNIEIVDQDGRSMFPEGSKEPFDRTRRLIEKLAGTLKTMSNRLSITGHTSASRVPPQPGYGPWELSADRANAVRQILEDQGITGSRLYMVAGKADTQPLFPDDPYIAANRRVTISVIREEPAIPVNFKP